MRKSGNPLKTRYLPIGLVLFALLLGVYKAAILTTSMGSGLLTFVVLVGLDLLFVAPVLMVAIFHGSTRFKLLQISSRLVLLLLAAFYLVDSFVLLALDEHAAPADIGRFLPEWRVALSFMDGPAYLAISLLLIAPFLVARLTPARMKLGMALITITLTIGSLNLFLAPQPLARYAMLGPAGLLGMWPSQQPAPVYSEEQIRFYASLDRTPVEVPAEKPNVILLVVESLSSINSKLLSGRGELLGRFDELAQEGLSFSNFLANHQASEGGLIALLSGFPPIHYPTATEYMFDEFAPQPSVIAEYRRQGYFVEFLTNANLGFIGLDRYLQGLGIDRSRGRDEVASMRDAPRIVQDAPPDDLLYAEALLRAESLALATQPFVLVLATTSTHLPYTHPNEGPDTAKAVWDWSLQQLMLFYRHLQTQGYFDEGILLITGDHRQMRPLTAAETHRYGDSARARVPLLVIGPGYPRGVLDGRYFQQADLLRMLERVQQPDAPLSPQPIWVERYNRKFGKIELIDKLSVFDQADDGRVEYRLKIPGNSIEWLDGKPDFAREVESRVHIQRSQHQRNRVLRLAVPKE